LKTQERQNTKTLLVERDMDWRLEIYPTAGGELAMQVVAPPDQRATAEAVAQELDAYFERCALLDQVITNFT
jgi:hypothetical protein